MRPLDVKGGGASLGEGLKDHAMPKLPKLVRFVMINSLIGILIGNLLAGAINYYIVQHPIIFGGELADLYQQYGFLPRMESSLDSTIFLKNTLIILGVSILMSLYPVFKVYKLEPLKGIRYT